MRPYLTFTLSTTTTTAIDTLSLHDALPISKAATTILPGCWTRPARSRTTAQWPEIHFSLIVMARSEEHTSELQSHVNLVCRLLLEKKNIIELAKLYPALNAAPFSLWRAGTK